MRLELGCGANPSDGYTHHDRWKHSPHVDLAFDLEQLPWPLGDESCSEIRAIDVFEHLRLEVQQWLDECWRVLVPGGKLEMRLPAWDNPLSWRDPTHRRVFHQESLLYWCPNHHGTLHRDFGRYYFGRDYNKWWRFHNVKRDHGDFLYTLYRPS